MTSRIRNFLILMMGTGFVFISFAFGQTDHLLLSEIAVRPDSDEFIEIINPTGFTVNLDNYFLSDDEDYCYLPGLFGDGPIPNISSSDFIAQFPPASVIEPGSVLIVALDAAGFEARFGFKANFELLGNDPAVPDMIPSAGGGGPDLYDGGENIVLFYWDGINDLVKDVDMLNVGDPGSGDDIRDKSGVLVDGPDPDIIPTAYLPDNFLMPVQAGNISDGLSTKRIGFEQTYEISSGGNGITGNDETSEDILTTWDNGISPPTPGIVDIIIPVDISGPLSGILSQSYIPFIVTSPAQVNPGDTLRITPGVKMLFNGGVGLDVQGYLDVSGSDSYFVSFAAYDTLMPWAGIQISPAADTLYMSNFDIHHAAQGLKIIDRPVLAKFAEIEKNMVGLLLEGPNGYLDAKHMIIAGNNVGLISTNNARSELRNLTIVNNDNEGIIADPDAQINIRNSIIWDNNMDMGKDADVRGNSAFAINMSYSTVDSVEGNIAPLVLSRIPPFFQPMLEDSMKYVPDTLSATIDAGDPNDEYLMEPEPNGGRINQGAYGGSPFAIPTYQPRLKIIPDTLNFASEVGNVDSTIVTIFNEGNVDLQVFNIQQNATEFSHNDSYASIILPGDSTEVTVSFLPDQRSPYNNSMYIETNDPHFPPPGLQLVLSGLGLNSPPVLTDTPPDTAFTDEVFNYEILAADADGDLLNFIPQQLPPWLSLIDINKLTGTPTLADTGLHIIDILINDGLDGETFFNHTLLVYNINDAPIINTLSLLDATQDVPYVDTVRATDADFDVVNYTHITKPPWMVVNPNGALAGIPADPDVGQNIQVQILALDGNGGRDTLTTSINVINVNDPPIFDVRPLRDAIEDIPYADTVFATDLDEDNLTFEALNIPTWMNVRTNGALAGLPTNDHVGTNYPVIIKVSDDTGARDTLTTTLNVLNTNDPPQIFMIPDTTIFTYLQFDYNVQGNDIDNDALLFSDNSPLFDIDAATGEISFTPTITDTGMYVITVNIDDSDLSASTSFMLTILPSPINPPLAVSITPGDQNIVLNWTNPDNQFYSGTKVKFRSIDDVIDQVILDSILTFGSSHQYTINNLDIGNEYVVSVINYFHPDVYLYSDAVELNATTLAPNIQFDLADRQLFIPPEDTLHSSLMVKNNGGGTLICRFTFTYDDSVNQWFFMDTLQQNIAPYDSAQIAYMIHPTRSMQEVTHRISLNIETNQSDWITKEFTMLMDILFDHDAPKLVMRNQPEGLHRFSAMQFNFIAKDSIQIHGWTIGDHDDSLKMKYKFQNLSNEQIIEEEENLPLRNLEFYPLTDGEYKLQLWVYDTHGNGYADSAIAFEKNVKIVASEVPLYPNRWYLTSVPREQDIPIFTLFDDSTSLIFKWSEEEEAYLPYRESVLKPGEGIWILSFNHKIFNVSAYPLVSGLDTVSVHLTKGWNQIGIPCGYPLQVADFKFKPSVRADFLTLTEAVNENLLAPAVFWYHSDDQIMGYEWGDFESTIAFPWRGYWINCAEEGELVFSHEPAFPTGNHADETETDSTDILGKISSNNWKLSLTLQNPTHRDKGNIIGISDKGKVLPVYEPPHLSDFCSAYFFAEQGKITQDLRHPFKTIDEVKEWKIQVSTSSIGKKHKLTWPNLGETELYLYLLDAEAGKIIDMHEKKNYDFTLNSAHREFILYATLDANFNPKLIPSSFKLEQNYPNPFNPSTTIRFGIPTQADGDHVSLKVFNLLGQEVKTLINKSMASGYHEVVWDGTNTQRRRVASGVYFYRLLSKKQTLVHKMVLLK